MQLQVIFSVVGPFLGWWVTASFSARSAATSTALPFAGWHGVPHGPRAWESGWHTEGQGWRPAGRQDLLGMGAGPSLTPTGTDGRGGREDLVQPSCGQASALTP